MKKILSIFAAMLVAVAVNATPVVLPATLDVNNVAFRSEGMPDFVLAEGDYAGTYFDMGAHDSSNDTLLYAEWDVTIEAINYNIAVDVYNENSWRVQLYVLNQAGDTVKSLRYKGSSGEKGQFAIGSIDMSDLEAGDYKVRARAATAWSKMKLKDVIFDADYSGVTVALPGTLLPAYAELSANASITNHAIAFKPSTAPDEYANWNVSFAEAGTYNVSIDITASNGHNYGVELIGEDEETSYGAVNEGGQKSDTGVKELGAIEVPAAGNYIVHLTNATQWSEAVLNSITFAAPAKRTIYCKVTADWWNWDYSNKTAVAAYAWVTNEDKNAEWPGVKMTAVENENGVWSIELDPKYTYVIFTRILPDGTYKGVKTADLTIPTDGNDLYTITRETFDWSSEALSESDGLWGKFTPTIIKDITLYYVNTLNWENVYAYTWDPAPEWPGEKATKTEQTYQGYNIWSYTTKSNRANIIFNDGTGGEGHQTADMKIEEGKPYYYNGVAYATLEDIPTAISNTAVEAKAVKMIENGQMIIIKNGVKYNAQGAIVK